MTKKPHRSGRKPKAKAAAKTRKKKGATGETPQQTTMTFPTNQEVVDGLEGIVRLKKSSRSASGMVGQRIEKLCSEKHFDKKALGVIRALVEAPDERFAITWPHILRYAAALEFDKRADAQPLLIKDQTPDKTEIEKAIEKNKAEGDDPKIHQLRQPREVQPPADTATG